MFPGQGSQRPGMAGGLEACGELFEIAAETLDADLARICTAKPGNGSRGSFPADLLQPALYVTATGASRALSSRGLCPDAVVGHSLGEYAALTAAGVLDFEDGLRLVSLRGKAMLNAARRNPGGMAAVIGLDTTAVKGICDGIDGAWVANLNSPTQTVMSGTDEALAQAAEAYRQAGSPPSWRSVLPGSCAGWPGPPCLTCRRRRWAATRRQRHSALRPPKHRMPSPASGRNELSSMTRRAFDVKGRGDELSIVLEPLGSEPVPLEVWGEPLDDVFGEGLSV